MNLTKIAARLTATTLVAAKAALKAAEMKQTLAPALLEALAQLQAARKTAQYDRASKKLGYCPVDAKYPRYFNRNRIVQRDVSPPVSPAKPAISLAGRLTRLRSAAVCTAFSRVIDHHTRGNWSVVLTDDPKKVDVTSGTYYTGEKAGTWALQATDTTITVPADWRLRVQRRGLDVVDGMMTLDAAPLEARGCELFAATWARRAGAKSVKVDRGYIARSGALTYHAATIDQALSGIAKKSRALALTAMLDSVDLSEMVAKHHSLSVSVKDAKKIGACEYGIKSWCAAVGLDFAAGAAPLADVYAAYQREPRAEARAAILQALRRSRKHLSASLPWDDGLKLSVTL